MDYGHTNPTPKQDFFTKGPGTNSEAVNNVEAENNLDLSNNNVTWTEPIERNPRVIGGSAITNSLETVFSPNISTSTSELGQVVDLNAPPASPEATIDTQSPISLAPSESVSQSLNEDIDEIKTTEHLNAAGITKVQKAINDLNKTGNADVFYKTVRDYMEENLEKSYGRELGKTT